MKKTDKKIEKMLVKVLRDVCEVALDEVVGFKWITHFVNYNNFPESLLIVCVFEDNAALSNAISSNQDIFLCGLIEAKLSSVGVDIKNIRQQVQLDSEQACEQEHAGNWHQRYRKNH